MRKEVSSSYSWSFVALNKKQKTKKPITFQHIMHLPPLASFLNDDFV